MALSKRKTWIIAGSAVLGVVAIVAAVAFSMVASLDRSAFDSPFADPIAAGVLVDEHNSGGSFGTTWLIDIGPNGEALVLFHPDANGWRDGVLEAGLAVIEREGTIQVVAEVGPYGSNLPFSKISATHVITPPSSQGGKWTFINRATAEATHARNFFYHQGRNFVGESSAVFVAVGGTAWIQNEDVSDRRLLSFSADGTQRMQGALSGRSIGFARDGCAGTDTIIGTMTFAAGDESVDAKGYYTYQTITLPLRPADEVAYAEAAELDRDADNLRPLLGALCGPEFIGTLRPSDDSSIPRGSLVSLDPGSGRSEVFLTGDHLDVLFSLRVTTNPRWAAATLVTRESLGISLLYDRDTDTQYGLPSWFRCDTILIRGDVVAWSEPTLGYYSWDTRGPVGHVTCETHTAILPE